MILSRVRKNILEPNPMHYPVGSADFHILMWTNLGTGYWVYLGVPGYCVLDATPVEMGE